MGGFSHVQDVGPNRDPTKQTPQTRESRTAAIQREILRPVGPLLWCDATQKSPCGAARVHDIWSI